MNFERDLNKSFVEAGKRSGFLERHNEWPGLENRLGAPRIDRHIYFPEFKRIVESHELSPDEMSFLEAGVGHGNDIRVVKQLLDQNGYKDSRILGIDYSEAEIKTGLNYYRDNQQSNVLFAQGDLRDLHHINKWGNEARSYCQEGAIKDGEFRFIYLEAILHAMGIVSNKYEDKKQAAQDVLKELHRVCMKGGIFFGRLNAYENGRRVELVNKFDEWRFIPEIDELNQIMQEVGFNIIQEQIKPRKIDKKPQNEGKYRYSFVAVKELEF